jgi:hypothetical protein
MYKIAFYSPHLSERGTETAMYDFADYNEKLLGNKSIIIYNPHCPSNNQTAIDKFKKRFEVFTLDIENDPGWVGEIITPAVDKIIKKEKCDIFYTQKIGKNDGVVSHVCKSIILACGLNCEPHGDAYMYVSKWLSDKASGGQVPYIPIIIDLPKNQGDLRKNLSIPENGIVFGRTGGLETWDIPWVNSCISRILEEKKNTYFVFQNTPKIFNHNRVKYVETTADNFFKAKFINTCDAMIHARHQGESFGQACAEFSHMNKPVITFSGSPEKSHIDILKEKGIYYDNQNDLYNILTKFTPDATKDWNCYKDHTPEKVMNKFNDIINSLFGR